MCAPERSHLRICLAVSGLLLALVATAPAAAAPERAERQAAPTQQAAPPGEQRERASLTGTVVDGDGRPMVQALVRLFGPNRLPAPDGQWR